MGRGVKDAACRGCSASYSARRAIADRASISTAVGINGPGWAMVTNRVGSRKNHEPVPFLFMVEKGELGGAGRADVAADGARDST